jgi:hypothetical protein
MWVTPCQEVSHSAPVLPYSTTYCLWSTHAALTYCSDAAGPVSSVGRWQHTASAAYPRCPSRIQIVDLAS